MPETEIDRVFAAYAAAVLAKDAEAFARLYAPDVQVFDTWARWSYEGVDDWKGMAAEWFGSLGEERVAVRFDGVRTVVDGDLAFAHAFVTYAALGPDGTELRSMDNRLTWALARADDRWTIVHEHTSSPADLATEKVMLQR